MATVFDQGARSAPLEDVVEPRNRRERRAKAAQQRRRKGVAKLKGGGDG